MLSMNEITNLKNVYFKNQICDECLYIFSIDDGVWQKIDRNNAFLDYKINSFNIRDAEMVEYNKTGENTVMKVCIACKESQERYTNKRGEVNTRKKYFFVNLCYENRDKCISLTNLPESVKVSNNYDFSLRTLFSLHCHQRL
jgi:hypothetical protein